MYLRSLTRTKPVALASGVVGSDAQSAMRETPVTAGSKEVKTVPDTPARAAGRDSPPAIAPATPASPPPPAEPPRAASEAGDATSEPAAIPGGNSSNITGTWDLTTQVESTKMESTQGRRFGYRIDFRQDGDHVRGRGYRVTENGQTVAADGQTPITLQGTIDGRELVLTFTEQGAQGTSSGRFVLNLGADLALRGSFQSDAAASRGSINARRRR
jgi:hypothetical protein